MICLSKFWYLQETLTTPASKFGSTCVIGDKFIEKLSKTGLTDKAIELLEYKDNKAVSAGDGKKQSRVKVAKLDDAIRAGTNESHKCTLILAEGDSAKSMVVSGISAIGKDYYGCYALKGKPLNTRDVTAIQLANNKEFSELKNCLGLKTGKVYKDVKDLRYGSIAIMSDSDLDGVHIKGLILNLIETCWPSLLENVPGFVRSIITPIVKATKGKDVISFYTLTEFQDWKNSAAADNTLNKYSIKYYKGLGTSTGNESKEYFLNLERNLITYTVPDLRESSEALSLAFDKKRADNRKIWLGGYDRSLILEATQQDVPIPDFVHKDLIHFSSADTIRSIPSMCDGLKPSQRKVLYGCLKRNLKTEAKVSQISGYIAETSSYHHGDASLQGCIINMAQDFVGSNNIHLLNPNGQFGTRLMMGKDAASPRYIFTNLNDLTTKLFHPDDAPLLHYLDDDGIPIEPMHYVPILPTILVNGTLGIGSGWSTFVPAYNPVDIVRAIQSLLEGDELQESQLQPWYRGFVGTIEILEDGGYMCHAAYTADGDTLTVTELPVGLSTEDFKQFLDDAMDKDKEPAKDAKRSKVQKSGVSLSSFENYSTESHINFIIKFCTGYLQKAMVSRDKFEAEWHLQKKINTSNMHLFDENGHITKFSSPEHVVRHFYNVRLDLYARRKAFLIKKLQRELRLLENKVRFLDDIIESRLIVFRRARADVVSDLESSGYQRFSSKPDLTADITDADGTFDYLTGMQVSSFTEERLTELQKQTENKQAELGALMKITKEQMWLQDLAEFSSSYDTWLKKKTSDLAENIPGPTRAAKGKGRKRKL